MTSIMATNVPDGLFAIYNVFNFYNVAVLLSTRRCLCSTFCGMISKGVSFTLSIACRLLYHLTELAILLLKFKEYFHRSFHLFA